MIKQIINLCLLLCSLSAIAQSTYPPPIYVNNNSRCGGEELYKLVASCQNGNTANCNQIEIEYQWIIDNCDSNGDHEQKESEEEDGSTEEPIQEESEEEDDGSTEEPIQEESEEEDDGSTTPNPVDNPPISLPPQTALAQSEVYGNKIQCPTYPVKTNGVCPKKDFWMEIVNDEWVFKYCDKQAMEPCACIGAGKILEKVSIPPGETPPPGKFTPNFIPVIFKKKQGGQPESLVFPFELKNYYYEWRSGQSTCPLALDEMNADNYVCSNPEHGPIRNRKICKNYDDFLNNIDTECAFGMLVPGNNKVFLVQEGKVAEVKGLPLNLFIPVGDDVKDRETADFLYTLTIILANDPSAQMLKAPTRENLKAFIIGEINGHPYLIGLDNHGTFYTPVELLQKGMHTKELIRALKSSESGKSFLKNEIIEDWYRTGRRKYIISYQLRGNNKQYTNPNEAFLDAKTWHSLPNINSIEFLIETRGGEPEYYIKGTHTPKRPTFYQKVHQLRNPWLALLAILDSDAKVLDIIGTDKVAIVSSNPDDLYALIVPLNGEAPNGVAVLEGEPDFSLDPKVRVMHAKTMKNNEQHYRVRFQKKTRDFLNGK
ncbi:MAG: hypothetical protein MI974_20915 [Chitinophagales bacterium]|nr:hypothetical protein [Chitinophagales bacterium]